MKKILLVFVFAGVCFAGGYSLRYMQSPVVPQMQRGALAYVPAGKAQAQPLNEATRYIALVRPLNAVDVRPQVVGEVEEVLFEDGQVVQEGDVLFRIDSDKYRAALAVAKATLAKAEADLKQIQNDYKRQEELYKDKFVSTADLEKSESKRLQAEAAVEQAKANLTLAEIDMKHTEVKAPISGQMGEALKTKGNYVSSGESLARLVQTTPVKIGFSLTDKEYLFMKKFFQQNGDLSGQRFRVELSDGTMLELPMDKIFVDNEMDRQTATVSLYAELDNDQGLLLPNNYVTILLDGAEKGQALTLPQNAVYNDAQGSYVMVVNSDQTVQQKYVRLGDLVGGRVFILDGLNPDEIVVLSGGQKLRNGQKIQPLTTEVQ